ncbi:MAG: hypothetical protein WCM76_09365 [Bacteroidota bacterium]
MKKNILAALVAAVPLFMASAFGQTTIQGKYLVQNISCTEAGTVMTEPYSVLFYENWKQNIAVDFSKDSVAYLSFDKKNSAHYQAGEGLITFYFTTGTAIKFGGQKTESPSLSSTTYQLEPIKEGYRLILEKGEHISIIELQKK